MTTLKNTIAIIVTKSRKEDGDYKVSTQMNVCGLVVDLAIERRGIPGYSRRNVLTAGTWAPMGKGHFER